MKNYRPWRKGAEASAPSLEAPRRPPVIAIGPDGIPRYAQGADPAPDPDAPILLKIPRATARMIAAVLDAHIEGTDFEMDQERRRTLAVVVNAIIDNLKRTRP